jgi:hypothetical protein
MNATIQGAPRAMTTESQTTSKRPVTAQVAAYLAQEKGQAR